MINHKQHQAIQTDRHVPSPLTFVVRVSNDWRFPHGATGIFCFCDRWPSSWHMYARGTRSVSVEIKE